MKKLTILIPCYNGGSMLKKNLPKLFKYMSNFKNIHFEVVVVNDGSTDNTLNILKKINKIKLLSYEKNKGKGWAIYYGIKCVSKCDAILIMDCDFSVALKYIKIFFDEINQYDMIIASRFSKDSIFKTKRSLLRTTMSKCCNLIVNFLFKFHFKDTQCGFKCIKYNLAKDIVNKQKVFGWAFDVEYLYIAKINNKKIKEIPIIYEENGYSSVKPFRASFDFIKSIAQIKRNSYL